jgi:hypothetical protein
MKNKRASDYFASITSPEEREKKVDAFVAEFHWIIDQSCGPLAAPDLTGWLAQVDLHPIHRVPLRRQTKAKTLPTTLSGESDIDLLASRKKLLRDFLHNREDMVRVWACGGTGFTLRLEATTDPDSLYPYRVELDYPDADGLQRHLNYG